MRITKTLTCETWQTSFWSDDNIGICSAFMSNFIKIVKSTTLTVKVTVSTTNPKKKGFRKVLWNVYEEYCRNQVTVNGKFYVICRSERNALSKAGLKEGDFFWVKAELV